MTTTDTTSDQNEPGETDEQRLERLLNDCLKAMHATVKELLNVAPHGEGESEDKIDKARDQIAYVRKYLSRLAGQKGADPGMAMAVVLLDNAAALLKARLREVEASARGLDRVRGEAGGEWRRSSRSWRADLARGVFDG